MKVVVRRGSPMELIKAGSFSIENNSHWFWVSQLYGFNVLAEIPSHVIECLYYIFYLVVIQNLIVQLRVGAFFDSIDFRVSFLLVEVLFTYLSY